jgi:hypothetical protein
MRQTRIAPKFPHPQNLGRRAFLIRSVAAGAVLAGGFAGPVDANAQAPANVDDAILETVMGPVQGKEIENALAHEHLFVDFFGSTDPNYMNVDWADVIGASVNAAGELRSQGVNLMIEWGPLGVGRNVLLLRHVSRAMGMHIVCPTGIYKSLIPPQFEGMSSEQIADHFIRELTIRQAGTRLRRRLRLRQSARSGSTTAITPPCIATSSPSSPNGSARPWHARSCATTSFAPSAAATR